MNDVIRSRMERATWDVTDAEEKAAHRETKEDAPERSSLKAGKRSVARGKQKGGRLCARKKQSNEIRACRTTAMPPEKERR